MPRLRALYMSNPQSEIWVPQNQLNFSGLATPCSLTYLFEAKVAVHPTCGGWCLPAVWGFKGTSQLAKLTELRPQTEKVPKSAKLVTPGPTEPLKGYL